MPLYDPELIKDVDVDVDVDVCYEFSFRVFSLFFLKALNFVENAFQS
jgi:hypothetical protein